MSSTSRRKAGIAAVVFAAIMALEPSYAADSTWVMQSAFSLTIGQTEIVYAARARNCTDEAPSFDDIKRELPKTILGSFADGGVVQRESARCAPLDARKTRGGWVKARAINFTATTPGFEIMSFYTDRVAVTIK